MSAKFPSWTEPAVWAFVVGAVVSWAVLDHGLGWMSPATAAELATRKAQDAVVAYATPACVARFERQPNAIAAWKTLKKTDEWQRGDLVVKDGWVAEPSQKLDSDTASAIASTCATKILALKTLEGAKLSLK